MFLAFAAFGLVAMATTTLMVQQRQDNRQNASGATFGQAASFVPSNGGSMEMVNPGGFINGPITVEAWIKPTLSTVNQETNIPIALFDRDKLQTGGSCGLYMRYRNDNGHRIDVDFNYFNTTNPGYPSPGSVILTTGRINEDSFQKWNHIAFTYDGSSEARVYWNGQKMSSYKIPVGDICKGAKNLVIGNDKTIANTYSGQIDEIRISKGAVYGPNFAPSFIPFNVDPNTIGLWHLDGNGVNITGYGYNGVERGVFGYVDSTIGMPDPTPTQSTQKLADFVVESFEGIPSSVAPGQRTNLKFKIRNTGSASGSPYYTVDQADGFSYFRSDSTCANYTILAPGESCTASFDIEFKAAGVKKLIVTIDPNNQVVEANERNNQFDFPYTVVQPTPTPVAIKWCGVKFSYARTTNAKTCLSGGRPNGYAKTVNFGCSDGYTGTLNYTACVSPSQLAAYATRECTKRTMVCK